MVVIGICLGAYQWEVCIAIVVPITNVFQANGEGPMATDIHWYTNR